MAKKQGKKGAKVNPDRKDWFTIRENELLEKLKILHTVKMVAHEMGISYRRAERILANIRDKWGRSVNTHNRLLAKCRNDENFRKLLSKSAPRVTPQVKAEDNLKE